MPPQATSMSISNLNPFRLTKLYSDAKISANNVTNAEQTLSATTSVDSPEYQALQRKLRIQKDRLVTWGLQWSDESKEKDGIDESIAQAGLTETVRNTMSTINEILEEVERMRTGAPIARVVSSSPLKIVPFPAPPAEESRDLSAEDVKRCEDLCQDLSSCIDVLYELSRSRRAIQDGTYPIAGPMPIRPTSASEKQTLPPPISKALFSNRSFSSSGETLVAPSRVSTEKTLAVSELPPRLDKRDLVLPQEPPPAYSSHGSQPVRMIGHLKQNHVSNAQNSTASQQQDAQPIMVEYAFFDPTYRETGVRLPPTEKLDALLSYFAKTNAQSDVTSNGTLPCAGWFEDLDYSRYGIVYELPQALCTPSPTGRPRDLRPSSLVSLLQSSSKSSNTAGGSRLAAAAVPPLEDRFKLAYSISRAVSRLHDDVDVLHRNICSNNVLFFTKSSGTDGDHEASAADQYELAEPFVVGFDLFTEYNVESEEELRQQQHLNIYQHPEASKRRKPYRAEYDAYSLGLVLLEIGLWTPLSDLWKAKYTLTDFRNRVEAIWVRKLASKVGSTYMNLVKDLLSATSRRNGPATLPETRARLSQLYSRSLVRLRRCCMIDEAENWDTPTAGSMQSSTLEDMVQQGIIMDHNQAIDRWKEKAQLFEEPSATTVAPTTHIGKVAQRVMSRFDDAHRTDSTTEHQYPHTLPVAIEEASEETLSRQGSNASRRRSGASMRWGIGLGSPRQKYNIETKPQNPAATTYQSAAQTIQRAWRRRRDAPSFQDYKRKITIIQQLWRRRRDSRTDTSATPSEAELSSFYRSNEHLEGQRKDRNIAGSTTIYITPQTQNPRKKLRIQPKQLPLAQITEWHAVLLPRLERIVDRALRESPETCSIDLLCVGDTLEKARPTIFVTCSSTARVKGALSRRFQYDRDAFDLKVRRGSIRRSKAHSASKRVREAHRSMAMPFASARDDGSAVPLNPFHQKRPICGASIGAYADAQHLPPVSFGGVIAVDDGGGPKLFGMTVHHLLDSPSDDEEVDDAAASESGYFDDSDEASTSPGVARSSAAGTSSWLAGMGAAPGLDLDASALSPGYLEISDDSSVASDADAPEMGYDSDDDYDQDGSLMNSHASTEGDLVGVVPGDEVANPIYVTQPAIDDVEDGFFPDIEDRDDDHLSSHRLGVVYASSGIRRWRRGDVAHEVDWALMKLDGDRLQPVNVVQGGRKYLRPPKEPPLTSNKASHKPKGSGIDTRSPNPFLEASNARRPMIRPKLVEPVSRSPSFSAVDDEYPTSIVPADQLASLRVHSFGRTSGLQEGVIGDCMSSVRIYRRRSFSRSWHVLGGFGMGGDSGAWILDNDTGRVCGHVLAFAERNSMAYICPLEIMFEDMLRVLNAQSIWLPGGEADAVRNNFQRCDTFGTNASGGAQQEEEEELPFDLNELGIEENDTDDRPGGVILRTSPVRPSARSSGLSRDHGRERLMYAPGGVLSMRRSESLVGEQREPQRLVA